MIDVAPESLADFNRLIKLHYPKLSKRLKQVAQYVLDAPREVAFGTVAVLSKSAGVHPSTWVRFSNFFGFGGFSEMQKLFQQNLMVETPNYQERIRMARKDFGHDDEGLSAHQLLHRFSHANASSLEQLDTMIHAVDLDSAIDILAQAYSVHVIGVRRAFVVASYFAYALRHIDRKAYLVDGMAGMYKEQAGALDKKDALIAISFSPYAEETLEVANTAVGKNVPFILVTDSLMSPLASLATVCFVVKEAEILSFRSLSSSLCLAQALSIGLAHKLEK